MTTFEFLDLLNLYPWVYLFFFFISIAIFSIVMKRTTSSWFNPVRFNIFTFSIGLSVVLFLNFQGFVSLQTFLYTIFSMFIFWVTFMSVFRNKQRTILIKFSEERTIARYLFYLSYGLSIGLTLLSYKILGIPALNEDGRLSTYTGSNLGFIYRLSPVLNVYSIIYIIHLFSEKGNIKRKVFATILLIPILIIGVLSGSRSSFLVIVFAFWGYRTFYLNKEPKASDFKWLAIPMILVSILSFLINASGDLTRVGFMLYERVVASGDLYWEALPDETWKSVTVNHPMKFTFMGFFGPLRILDSSHAEIPIGFQLTSIIYPSIAGTSTGPVALFPVFGLVCFGYIGGLIFSFLQALLAGSLFKFSFVKSNSIIISSLAYFTFNSFIALIGDISAGLSSLLDVFLSYILMLVLLILVGLFYYSKDILFKQMNSQEN